MQPFGADQSEHEAMFHDHVYKFRNARIPQHESGWYFHSEEVIKHRHWNIQQGEVVVDVGACFGSWTIPALLQGATVYAYEPHPLLYTELCHNVSINGLSSHLVAKNKAVWYGSGFIRDLPQLDLSMILQSGDNQPVLKVMTVALDDELLDIPRLDWIKVDVEGAEIEVLKGARQLIEKFNPRIIVEWHADRNKDPEMRYLDGWQVKQIDPGHYLVQLK
jgi:FkbM family methyltransferase